MSSNEIKVTVSGSNGSGKSVITLEIVKALRTIGFEVEWDLGIDYTSESQVEKNQPERLKAILNKVTKIVVNEQQLNRTPIKIG